MSLEGFPRWIGIGEGSPPNGCCRTLPPAQGIPPSRLFLELRPNLSLADHAEIELNELLVDVARHQLEAPIRMESGP